MVDAKAAFLAVTLLLSAVATPASARAPVEADRAAPVLATPPDGRVPLDVGRTQVATVTVRGERYRVYRYDNVFPTAEGVEIYHDGARVTGESDARSVARAVAWQRAANRLDGDDLRSLRRTRDTMREIEQFVQPPIDALTAALAVRSELRNTSAGGASAWTALRTKAPSLILAAEGIKALRNELQEWKELSRETGSELDYVITAVTRLREGRDVNYVQLDRQATAAREGMGELRTRSLDLSNRLVSASDGLQTLADTAPLVPEVGDDAKRTLGDAAGTLNDTSADLDRFATRLQNQRARLAALERTADEQEDAVVSAWRVRESATLRVFASLGLVLAGLVGLGVVVRRRRAIRDRLGRVAARGRNLAHAAYYGDLLKDGEAGAGPDYCPACGVDLYETNAPKFCPNCGTRFDVDEPTYHEPRDE